MVKLSIVAIHLFRVLQYNDCKVEGGGMGGGLKLCSC